LFAFSTNLTELPAGKVHALLHVVVDVNVTLPPDVEGLRLEATPVIVFTASVKVHVTAPDDAPVAVTVYTATNQSGRLNSSEIAPSPAAVTSTSRRHVSPASSLTLMCTDSPGAQLAPESVTCSPGA